MSERFGSLRSLLHASPSRKTWLELCEELERWPRGGELDELAIPYARDILAGWPAWMLAPPDGFDRPPDLPWVGLVRRVRGLSVAASAWQREIHARGGWIDHLELSSGSTTQIIETVLTHARAFKHLSVERGALDVAFARDLAARDLPALRALSLDLNPLGDEGCYALARATWWTRLEELSLSQVGATDAGAAALVARPLPNLHTLDLSSNGVGDRGVLALCSDGALPALHTLDLSDSVVADEGALALEEFFGSRLQALDLSYNRIGPRIVALLERLSSRNIDSIIDVSENTPPRGYVDPFGEDVDVEEISWRDWERADDLDEWETWTTWKRGKK